LLSIGQIQGEVKGSFQPLRYGHIRGVTAEADSDKGVSFTIDDERGGNFDIGVVEILQFRFPVICLEFEEERPEDVGIVQILVGILGRFLRLDTRPRPGRFGISHPPEWSDERGAEAAGSWWRGTEAAGSGWRRTEPAGIAKLASTSRHRVVSALFFEEFSGGGSFFGIEPAVAIFIEFLGEFVRFTMGWAEDHPGAISRTGRLLP
jgi:hypothetical protein